MNIGEKASDDVCLLEQYSTRTAHTQSGDESAYDIASFTPVVVFACVTTVNKTRTTIFEDGDLLRDVA
jgi:hypothetical protein